MQHSGTPQSTDLEAMAAQIRIALDATNRSREEALRLSRETIQLCSRSIRALHRGERQTAESLAADAGKRIQDVRRATKEHPEVYYAGYVHDSQKEYVEACSMLAIIGGTPLPSYEDLHVEPAAFLNGIAEAASESRRYVLDRMLTGDMESAETVLKIMDDIYYELVGIDYPDAITGGLRRTTDALRAVLERTRGDMTHTVVNRRLETALLQLQSSQAAKTENIL